MSVRSWLDQFTGAAVLREVRGIREVVNRVESTVSVLQESIGKVATAVAGVSERVGSKYDELTVALAAERAANADLRDRAEALAAAEDAEDVQQNADLDAASTRATEAQAATDALLAEAGTAAGQLEGLASTLDGIAADPDAPVEVPETPVDPEPTPVDPGPAVPEQPEVPEPVVVPEPSGEEAGRS